MLRWVAAVSFSFPGGEIKLAASELGAEQKLGRKREHIYRVSEKGEGVERKGVACLAPSPLFFASAGSFVPFACFFGKAGSTYINLYLP